MVLRSLINFNDTLRYSLAYIEIYGINRLTTGSTWWRVNFIFGLDNGYTLYNEGDIYVSLAGATTTAGLPDAGNTVAAVINTFNSSSMGK